MKFEISNPSKGHSLISGPNLKILRIAPSNACAIALLFLVVGTVWGQGISTPPPNGMVGYGVSVGNLPSCGEML